MNDLQHQFVTDAEELVENLFRALQQLRVRQSVGRIRRQLTGQIFRQVHTLEQFLDRCRLHERDRTAIGAR